MHANRELLGDIITLARLIRTEADRRARAHGMTRAQWGILVRLRQHPGLRQKELAEMLEVEPITVARLIDRLEARAMVERRADAHDRRCWHLHLGDAATPLLSEIEQQLDEIARHLCAGLTPEAVCEAARIVTHLRDRAQELRAASPELPPAEA